LDANNTITLDFEIQSSSIDEVQVQEVYGTSGDPIGLLVDLGIIQTFYTNVVDVLLNGSMVTF